MLKIILSILIIFLVNSNGYTKTIKIGSIQDQTGPTSFIGKEHAQGIADYIEYINKKGGINNNIIELETIDYQYKIPKSLASFQKFADDKDVIAVFGWGASDGKEIASLADKAGLLFIPGSFVSFNQDSFRKFVFNPISTYKDQLSVLLKHIAFIHRHSTEMPKVVIVYHNSLFGRAPLDKVKELAEELNIDIINTAPQNSDLVDAVEIMESIKLLNPDYIIIHDVFERALMDIRDGKRIMPKVQFLGTYYTFDQRLSDAVGKDFDGFITIAPYKDWNSDAEGIKEIKDFNSGVNERSINYIQGWASAKILCKSIEKSRENPSRENIKDSIKLFASTDGVTNKNNLMIYRFNAKYGKFEPFSDWIQIPE